MVLERGTRLGPYEVLEHVGAGGMGEVYRARDRRLDRTVALKLLPAPLTRDDVAKARFIQEAKAASALDHPNICTIHDIGEREDGQLYLAMAHYDGGTLTEKIARGPMPIEGALDVATQIAQGLVKAHGSGLTHRDIKPANIMFTTDEVVKIVDFGLVKLAGQTGLTQAGMMMMMGTVAYMSPEQMRAEEVDGRTDIWALGVVLYEMLAGQRPFRGDHQLVIVTAIQQDVPRPVSELRPSVPSELEQVVDRMLEKEAGDRYQTTADLLLALRRLQQDSSVLAAASRSGSGSVDTTRPPGDVPTSAVTASESGGIRSVAVLAFANMSADPDQEYFCDGLAEELIDTLAKLERVRVTARTSSFQFKGQSLDVRKIGELLNVSAVLDGSVRKAGNRLRITAQLVNVSDGYQLWSERYDRTMDDLFAVQEEIARSIVEKLKVKLVGEMSGPLIERPPANLEAYNLFLKGRHHVLRLGKDELIRAERCFREALELEPGYAPELVPGWAESTGRWGRSDGKRLSRSCRRCRRPRSRSCRSTTRSPTVTGSTARI